MGPMNKSQEARAKALAKLKQTKEQPQDTKDLIKDLLDGKIAALSRGITLIESKQAGHRKQAREILDACLPYSGKAKRIGITGVPGVGKSSFLEAFGMYLLKNYDQKIAVLAVDPSSQSSGGSILGDKTRMEELSMEEKVFIRPSPSASSLGGVARKTRETLLLCEAAGFDTIFIETVGVGQSETTVKNMVDFFLLLMLSGAGDELQGIKRGIMEMADALIVTKADGANLGPARRAASSYKSAMHLLAPTHRGWSPKVDICSAHKKDNLDKVWNIIREFYDEGERLGFISELRKKQNLSWFTQSVEDLFHEEIQAYPEVHEQFKTLQNEVAKDKTLAHDAAKQFLDFYKNFLAKN